MYIYLYINLMYIFHAIENLFILEVEITEFFHSFFFFPFQSLNLIFNFLLFEYKLQAVVEI